MARRASWLILAVLLVFAARTHTAHADADDMQGVPVGAWYDDPLTADRSSWGSP